jgi:hypothetical protein
MVFVGDGVVTRVRAVDPEVPVHTWPTNNAGKVRVPLGPALLTAAEVADQFPTLPLRPGDARPAVRGRLWESVPL